MTRNGSMCTTAYFSPRCGMRRRSGFRSEIWIAGVPPRGPWLLSIDHPGVAAELATLPPSPLPGPGLATFGFDTLTALHAALDRVYKLGVSLPDAPLARFRTQTAGLPQATETERLVVQRIGQDIFRSALVDYWGGRCPITGTEREPVPIAGGARKTAL
jgi:hypothetical protein